MASEVTSQEPATHQTPAPGALHVDSSTKSTGTAPPPQPIISTKREQSEGRPFISDAHRRKIEDAPPMVVVTEGGPSDTTMAAEDGDETASVVSMPAAVPTTAADNAENASSINLMPQDDTDAASVASAPAVVVDVEGEIGSSELEEILQSPHANNAIVERSPGGRYVRFMEKLGSGASKDVYRAYDTQEGIEVAWNVVHLAGVPKNERNRIVNEVRLLERLHHHNIISFHGSWVNREKQQVNFVTEILSSGTLQSFINKVQVIRWKIAKRWAVQILKGLEYLHSQDPPVIHRDLKCQNIFINGTSGDLRIGDLGLSTVHRNGKALSVLGTPEFMAPDMYEESAYDEKVDIYAFGMCLLEIFTKEIPYSECSNPAQIYRKVIRGDPPDSLKRLKSRHAREFIKLCLGQKDESGNYIRPSAKELLEHPFLQQRPSDDDEVEVSPPMQERAIKEAPESSSEGSKVAAVMAPSAPKTTNTAKTVVVSSPSQQSQPNPSTNSLEDVGSDTFEQMPDSEISFRQPKVLMGRGQELQRDNENVSVSNDIGQVYKVKEGEIVVPEPTAPMVPIPQINTGEQRPGPGHQQGPQQTQGSFHFLVAAAVIEDEFSNTRPYEDDILKLVVTLPVEGQTQNVQFDFHLVEDDAIQVAKEMVAELGIPQAAVLEISETISGLARAARVKQDKYIARINNKSNHHPSRSASQGVLSQMHSDMMQPQHQSIGHGPSVMQGQNHPPIPDFMNAPNLQGQQGAPQYGQQQMISPQDHSSHHLGQSMHQIPMAPQHLQSSDSSNNLPVNQQLQSPPMQNQPAGQHGGQGDQSAQGAPAGHGQHQQQNWNQSTVPTPPPQEAQPAMGQANYSNASIVRSVSGGTQAELAPGQGYGQSNIHHGQVQNQPNGQNTGMQQNGSYSQLSVQQGQAQMTNQQGQQSVQQGADGYNQVPRQPMPVQNQPQGHQAPQQTNDHHGLPPNAYAPSPHAHAMQPQQHGIQNLGQGQAPAPAYSHQSQMPPPQNGPSPVPMQPQNQGQFLQGSNGTPAPNMQQAAVSQSPNQQFQMMHPNGNQGYGQTPTQQNQATNGQPSQAQQQPQSFSMENSQRGIPQNHHAQQHATIPNQSLSASQNQNQGPQNQLNQQPQSTGNHASAMVAPDHEVAPEAQQHQAKIASPPDEFVPNASSALKRQSSNISDDVKPSSSHMNGVRGVPSIDSDDEDLNDDKLAAELRKLDEDFQKHMARAQKVFDTRMDNLARTQVQREAQHQKTLERHQKERADFEKRRQQEEIEQNRRIEQLQKDWAERREAMRQKKQRDAQAAAESGSPGVQPTEFSSDVKDTAGSNVQ